MSLAPSFCCACGCCCVCGCSAASSLTLSDFSVWFLLRERLRPRVCLGLSWLLLSLLSDDFSLVGAVVFSSLSLRRFLLLPERLFRRLSLLRRRLFWLLLLRGFSFGFGFSSTSSSLANKPDNHLPIPANKPVCFSTGFSSAFGGTTGAWLGAISPCKAGSSRFAGAVTPGDASLVSNSARLIL